MSTYYVDKTLLKKLTGCDPNTSTLDHIAVICNQGYVNIYVDVYAYITILCLHNELITSN